MKVLIWACGQEVRFAGPHIYREAKRQGLDVELCFSRMEPQGMVDALQTYKPDWVFCLVIRPNYNKYYQLIKQSGAKLLFWYPDQCDQARDRMWRSLEGQADVAVFSILHTAQTYSRLFPVTLWMPQYFDHRFCMKNDQLPERFGKESGRPMHIYDLCFIGSCDGRRQDFLERLSKCYDCLFIIHPPHQLNEIRGYNMALAYAQSKIAFNIQRTQFLNPGAFITSNRAYNAMGSGAFFINHYVKEIDRVWELGRHCVMYNDNFDDLRMKIDHWLIHRIQREEIAKCGKENILQYHTLEQRVKEYWAVMENISDNHTEWLRTKFPAGYGEWIYG